MLRRVVVVVAVAVLAAASVSGVVLIRHGDAPGSSGDARPARPSERQVRVGDLEFTYGGAWRRAASHEFRQMTGAPRDTEVVAAICADECGSVDVTYVLFGSHGSDFFSLGAMERGFDESFRARFTDFQRVSASELVTTDDVRFLRYEFTFRRGGQQWREVIAAYRVAGSGVIAMAQGPSDDFAAHRDSVLKLMASASISGE